MKKISTMLLITAMAGMASAVIVCETTFPTNSLTLIGAGDVVTNLAATTTSSGGNWYGSTAASISGGDDGRLNIITGKSGDIGGAGVLLDSSLCTAHAEEPNVLFIIADDLMKQVELYDHYHQNDTPLSLRNIAAEHRELAEFMKTHCRKVK